MDPMTLMAIGAALGIGKNEMFDKPQAAKLRNYEAQVAKYSPWTHMNASPVLDPSSFDRGLQGGMTGLAIGQQIPGKDPVPPADPQFNGTGATSMGGGGMLADGPTSTGSGTGDFLGGSMSTGQYLDGVQPAPNPAQGMGPMAVQPPAAGNPFMRAARRRTTNGYPGYYPGNSPWMGQ